MNPPFIYPTHPGWLEDMERRWQRSGKAHFSFCFHEFRPRTLPDEGPFWMYFVFTKKRTDDPEEVWRVRFRVRVIETSDALYRNQQDVFYFPFKSPRQPKIWFMCDVFEAVGSNDSTGSLWLSDFEHLHGKYLPSTIRNSIAPVKLRPGKITEVIRTTFAGGNAPASAEYRYWVNGERHIYPLHRRLQEEFVRFLSRHGIKAKQDKGFIDVQYKWRGDLYFCEIKPTDNVKTRIAIRQAIGQLLEHRFLRNRDAKLEVVLGHPPSRAERTFLRSLNIRVAFRRSSGEFVSEVLSFGK